MKKILIISVFTFLFSFYSYSQEIENFLTRDTIYTIKKAIPCKIVKIGEKNLTYMVNFGEYCEISLIKVVKYVMKEEKLKDPILTSLILSKGKFQSETDTLEYELQLIKYHLLQSHKEFKTGTILFGLGLSSTLIGTIILMGSDSQSNNKSPMIIISCGSLLMFSGFIVQMDSHKWIGKAGLTGFQIGYKF